MFKCCGLEIFIFMLFFLLFFLKNIMLTKVAYSKNTENIQKILFKMDLFYLNMF